MRACILNLSVLSFIHFQIKSKMPGTVVACSGYFDPIHPGHIEYLEMSKSLGDKLYVIVNNDNQATMKKGELYFIFLLFCEYAILFMSRLLPKLIKLIS